MKRTARGAVPPEGFRYEAGLLVPDEERALVEQIETLPLEEFEFHGYRGKRRVISYGWHYSYDSEMLGPASEIPGFLLPAREKAAAFAGISATDLAHALVTEYRPGTAIGWHRDKKVFGDVIGISLGSECVFRLRRRMESSWERHSQILERCSAYLLRGEARTEWQHSIPAVPDLRYSITFRSLREHR